MVYYEHSHLKKLGVEQVQKLQLFHRRANRSFLCLLQNKELSCSTRYEWLVLLVFHHELYLLFLLFFGFLCLSGDRGRALHSGSEGGEVLLLEVGLLLFLLVIATGIYDRTSSVFSLIRVVWITLILHLLVPFLLRVVLRNRVAIHVNALELSVALHCRVIHARVLLHHRVGHHMHLRLHRRFRGFFLSLLLWHKNSPGFFQSGASRPLCLRSLFWSGCRRWLGFSRLCWVRDASVWIRHLFQCALSGN